MNLPRCDACGSFLNCETNWLGQMLYLHPGKCVPVPERHFRACYTCGKELVFDIEPPYQKRQFSCSPECESKIENTRRQQQREVWRRYAKRKYVQKSA